MDQRDFKVDQNELLVQSHKKTLWNLVLQHTNVDQKSTTSFNTEKQLYKQLIIWNYLSDSPNLFRPAAAMYSAKHQTGELQKVFMASLFLI